MVNRTKKKGGKNFVLTLTLMTVKKWISRCELLEIRARACACSECNRREVVDEENAIDDGSRMLEAATDFIGGLRWTLKDFISHVLHFNAPRRNANLPRTE
jgi:hypothetical protein